MHCGSRDVRQAEARSGVSPEHRRAVCPRAPSHKAGVYSPPIRSGQGPSRGPHRRSEPRQPLPPGLSSSCPSEVRPPTHPRQGPEPSATTGSPPQRRGAGGGLGGADNMPPPRVDNGAHTIQCTSDFATRAASGRPRLPPAATLGVRCMPLHGYGIDACLRRHRPDGCYSPRHDIVSCHNRGWPTPLLRRRRKAAVTTETS